MVEPREEGAPWDAEADTDAEGSEAEGEEGDEGALTEMSSLCPLWDDMLPLDAVSLKTKQARPLSGFALREAVPTLTLTSNGLVVRSSLALHGVTRGRAFTDAVEGCFGMVTANPMYRCSMRSETWSRTTWTRSWQHWRSWLGWVGATMRYVQAACNPHYTTLQLLQTR